MKSIGWKAARVTLITIALSAFGGAAFSVFAGDEPSNSGDHANNGDHSASNTGERANGEHASKITYPADRADAIADAKADAKTNGEDKVENRGDGHGNGHSENRTGSAPEKDPALAGGCLADVSALEDLKRRKTELEAGQKELAAKEAELRARERALTDEMAKLAEARDEIARMEDSGKKISEEKVAKLVETIEGMSPKAGSALISSIDEPLAVAAMTRISTPKLSKLMNVMEPARSTRLSELMAGVVRAKKPKPVSKNASNGADDAAETTVNMPAKPAKGGEKYDGKNNEQASRIPGGNAGAERQPGSNRQ